MISPHIQLQHISLSYGDVQALDDVSLTVQPGEHICILGGNGSGKSSLLQVIAGLLEPQTGSVQIMKTTLEEPDSIHYIRQYLAMVFQQPEDQLVTSIVADDVAFGPENLGVSAAEIAKRVDAALAAVHMSAYADADPTTLSGGQMQRIALAGALAMNPRILLLDEPSAMLDAEGHADIQRIIVQLNQQGITIVHVSHFMEDALDADRVFVLQQGKIAYEGSPCEVFANRTRVQELGLELPFSLRVAAQLEDAGYILPVCAQEDELISWLQEHISKPVDGMGVQHGPGVQNSYKPTGQPLGSGIDSNMLAANKAVSTQDINAPALSVEQVSFSYSAPSNTSSNFAVENLNFTISPGSLVALVGRTGSGKSTTAELLAAHIQPNTGRIFVGDISTADKRRRAELRRNIGYVTQLPERQLFAQTVFDDIAFGPRNLGCSNDEVQRRVIDALSTLGISAREDFLMRSPFNLSGGQQRSVALAGILAMQQACIIFDEPMAGLDPVGRDHMRATLMRLKAAGTTLIVITHSLDDVAEFADQLICMEQGHIVAQGSPRAVFSAQPLRTPGLPAALHLSQHLQALGLLSKTTPSALTLTELVEQLLIALDTPSHSMSKEERHGDTH
ncbi:ATP-binding cassette domain-containing protein [Collinsella sp. zg1085]|uniref:ABC transporter ATP-binding protein n=1 Tax=Collinsella sp. zg1085 TaxID=2844380 RepID=UPI001C0D9B74|nr:energy-coupling factor transporter ATPase [Collinsella sp. zg1085]QWT17738.1 ATP-binding cassette domain-containing protein [Collinsella sp. zg1085]